MMQTAAGAALMLACYATSSGRAASTVIYGGATYSGGPGGSGGTVDQAMQTQPGTPLATGGVAVARGTQAYFVDAPSNPIGDNTASYSFTSNGVTPLQSIGTRPVSPSNPTGANPNSTQVYAVNASGMSSGVIQNSTFSVITAVRWNAAGAPTALQPLSTSTAATADAQGNGYVINNAGVVAGSSRQYGDSSTGATTGTSNLGSRPVFWAANATTPTPLGIYEVGSVFGVRYSSAGSVQAINTAGTMVGVAERFVATNDGSGADLGSRASVWAPGGGAATELPSLTASSSGAVSSFARVINDNGVVGGYSQKFSGSTSLGQLPVRWNTSNTVQELDHSGVSTSGTTSGDVLGINASGSVVGKLNYYDGSGTSLGTLPALWKAGGTALTNLGLLGTSATGSSAGNDYSINRFGFSVGNVNDYTTGGDQFGTASGTSVATFWDFNGGVTDLNTLIPTLTAGSTTPGWVLLTQAYGITDDGWITGVGTYNPGGGLPTYTRAYLIQTSLVPEPAAATAVIAGVLSLRRRRSGTFATAPAN